MTRAIAGLFIALALASGAAACGGTGSDYALGDIEDFIATDWQKQANDLVAGANLDKVACSETSGASTDAKCIVNYSLDGSSAVEMVDVTYTDDGGFIWEAAR